MSKNNLYKVGDLVLIAILRVNGILPASVAKETIGQRARVAFYFKDDAELQDIVQEHAERKCSVEPAGFYDAVRRTKAEIFSMLTGTELNWQERERK